MLACSALAKVWALLVLQNVLPPHRFLINYYSLKIWWPIVLCLCCRCCQVHDNCYGQATRLHGCQSAIDSLAIKHYIYRCDVASKTITCSSEFSTKLPCNIEERKFPDAFAETVQHSLQTQFRICFSAFVIQEATVHVRGSSVSVTGRQQCALPGHHITRKM